MTPMAPTHLAVVPTAAPVNMEEFFQELLPINGPYWMLAHRAAGRSDGMVHESFDSREEMAARARTLDGANAEVWHAVASFTHCHNETKGEGLGAWGRKKENVHSLAAFFLDIDVDPEKPGKAFRTILEAETALDAFVQALGVPYQCLVHSGGGLHVYWMLVDDISRSEWEPVALKLKDAARAAGLLADPSRTADAASLLRPHGTTNRKPKYGHKGQPVVAQWGGYRGGSSRIRVVDMDAACERIRSEGRGMISGAPKAGTTLTVIQPRHWFDELSVADKVCTLASMLAVLPKEQVSERSDWLAVGAALAGVEGVPRETRFELWSAWSQSTEDGAASWAEDAPEIQRQRWDGLTRSGVGALITRAYAAGWTPERLRDDPQGQVAFPVVVAAISASGERWTLAQARAYMDAHVVFVSSDNQYLRNGLPLSKEALDTSLARHLPVGLGRNITASVLIKRGSGQIVDYLGYKPGAERIFVDSDGRRIANTWKLHLIEAIQWTMQDARTFADLIKHLGSGDLETEAGIKRVFVKIAYLYRHPSARIRHATLLIGRNEGCGKSTITFEIPRALFGGANVRSVETRELSSDFNGYAQGAQILVFPELWLGSRKDAQAQANNLKPLITDDYIPVVKKGKDGRSVQNCTTIFASSNHEDAAFFGAHDRRYDVISTSAPSMPLELAKRVYALINERPGSLLTLCLAYGKDAAVFNPNAAPLQTTAKTAMMETNRGGWAQRMRDAFGAREWPFIGDAVAVSDVITLLGEEFRPAPSDKAIRCEILSMSNGAYSVAAQRRHAGRVLTKRLIVLRDIDRWKEAGTTALYAHYEETTVKFRDR
jgi:hypothetical protein